MMQKRWRGNETTSPNSNSSNETTSVTNTATTKSNNAYVYGIGILAVLAIGFVYFLTYNSFQPKTKKIVNEKQDQPPKRLHVFKRSIINE